MNNSTAMISVTDLQGRYMLVKHGFERLLHAKSEFLVGKTVYDLLPREHADKIRASDQRVLDSGIVLEVEEVTLRAAQDFVSHSDTRRTEVADGAPASRLAEVTSTSAERGKDVTL